MNARPAPPWRAVVFDLDGTLTDSTGGICRTFETVLVEAGHRPPPVDEVRTMIGLPLRSMFARHAAGADEATLDLLVDRYRALYAAAVIPETRLFPRTWSLLRSCRAADLRLGLVTAKHTLVAEAVLARCRIRTLFHSVVGGDRAARPKPNPDLLLVGLAELGVPPGEVVVVGDADHDIAMGRAVGAATCGVAWGAHDARRLEDAGATWVVHSTRDLFRILLGEASPSR